MLAIKLKKFPVESLRFRRQMLHQQWRQQRRRRMSIPDPIYQPSSVLNASENYRVIMICELCEPKTHRDISISQLNAEPAKSCTGKTLATVAEGARLAKEESSTSTERKMIRYIV